MPNKDNVNTRQNNTVFNGTLLVRDHVDFIETRNASLGKTISQKSVRFPI